MEKNIVGGIETHYADQENLRLLTEEGERNWFDESLDLHEFLAHAAVHGNAPSLCNNAWIMRSPTKNHYYVVHFNGTDPGKELFEVKFVQRDRDFTVMRPLKIPKRLISASHA